MNLGIWRNTLKTREDNRSVRESEYIKVVQLLLQAESGIFEECSADTCFHIIYYLRDSFLQSGNQRRSVLMDFPYLQRLKECGFRFGPEASEFAVYPFVRLTLAIEQVSAEMVGKILQLLPDLGLDIYAINSDGDLLLYWLFLDPREEAHAHNMIEVVTALLQNGADPCALDGSGKSLFDWAEYRGWNAEWFEALERAGYDAGEVEEETRRRKWLRYHPGDAYVSGRSGVDEELVASPSRKGLVRRRAVPGDRLEE